MGRAELASAGVRGRSDGHVERRAGCDYVKPCDNMSGQCAITEEPCERTVYVASAMHAVSVASHPAENSGSWICE